MIPTAADVLHSIDEFAPWDRAEAWDNTGLLAGSMDMPVRGVLCALDLSETVLAEAEKLGVDLIVAHHPILFRGRKNLREDDPEGALLCKLVRGGFGMIAAHTNFDMASGGVNDALAKRLGLEKTLEMKCGGRIGHIEETTLDMFVTRVEEKLGDKARVYGDGAKRVSRIAVMGGAGGDFVQEALRVGADVYVTGEIGYHKALDCQQMGMAILEAGHRATEMPAVSAMADALRTAFRRHQYAISVNVSASALF